MIISTYLSESQDMHKSKRQTSIVPKFFLVVVSASLLSGCISQPVRSGVSPIKIESRAENRLTYGAIKKHLEIGKTTQADVLKEFGSPNNMTVSSSGTEVWVYDKVRTEISSVSNATSSGGFLGAGFGDGTGGLGVGVGGRNSQSSSQVVSSTKTLTVIMEFNKQNILSDFSARTGRY